MYADKLDDIVDNYNNVYHRTIKMRLIDVKTSIYNNFDVQHNDKDSKFKVGDYIRISKYKKIFAKCYKPNWSENYFFLIKKVKNKVPWTYIISNLNGEKIRETFHDKELPKNKLNIV